MSDSDEHGEVGYRLVVQFFNDSPHFRDGWECGVLYARMRYGFETFIEQTVHADNLGQIRHMVTALDGWHLYDEQRVDDTWCTVSIVYRGA